MDSRNPFKNSAFTLIELLAAVAIIAILVTLIFSAVSAINQSAKAAACVAKLRGFGNALALYSAENNGDIPPGYGIYPSEPDRGNQTYGRALALYGIKPAELDCPATHVNGKGIYRKKWPDWFSDYTFNSNIFVNSGVFRIRKRHEFPATTTIAAYDGYGRLAARPASNPEALNSSGFFSSSQAAPRHRGQVNVLFLDAHVESVTEMPTDPALWGSGPSVK